MKIKRFNEGLNNDFTPEYAKKKIEEYIEYLHFFTNVVDISKVNYHFEQDPCDNHIIETYIAGKCDYLITGDQAILSLKNEFNVISLENFLTKHLFL